MRNNTPPKLKVYLVDDEPLAIRRLSRLLTREGRVEILGSSTDAQQAVSFLARQHIDVLFLDIEMPIVNGFEMLRQLSRPPMVIFTTAFDQYALQAFEVNSIDYLMKPIESAQLERALNKAEGFLRQGRQLDWGAVVDDLAATLSAAQSRFPTRIASRVGERTQFIDLARVTHFVAENKLTYAETATKSYVVDESIAELEQRLDPMVFVRIHRGILLNTKYVAEMQQWFGGRALVRLKDEKRTELAVARDRVRMLKDHLRS